VKISIPYTPREAFIPFHESDKRFAILVCHRRAGKTVSVLNQILKTTLLCKLPNPRGIFVAPSFAQAKDISWKYLKHYTRDIPGTEFHEAELRCTLPTGGIIRLYGAENPDRLRGIYADIAGLDEPASMDLSIWESVIRPALSDRNGKAVFIGTPFGEDSFFDIYQNALTDPDWFHMKLRASESGILPPSELTAARKIMTPEAYEREYEVSFSATFPGAFYAKDVETAQDEGRIKFVPHDKSLETFAAVDLGMDDSTAIWTWQLYANEWRFLEYYENQSKGLDHYITWIKNRDYKVDKVFLPHDAKVRELGIGKSRHQYFLDRGIDAEVLQKTSITDGISAVRLAFNRMWFNVKGCEKGIKALRNYRSDFNSKNKVLRNSPRHDWSSHGADAMRYAVMSMNEYYGVGASNWDEPISRNTTGTFV
jgi:phage terminase large subunit